MENYLLTNLTVSSLVLITFVYLKNAPARLRLYLLLVALFSWLLPWQKLLGNLPVNSIIPSQVSAYSQEIMTYMFQENNDLANTANSNQPLIDSSTTLANNTPAYVTWFDSLAMYVESLFTLSLVIGLALLVKDIWLYKRQVNHWLKHSTPLPNLYSKHQIQITEKEQHIPICLVEGSSPGMATGILKPTIWLAAAHYNSAHSKTIITHELNHIRQHDPLWMWLITLAQRLLWWNPIAFYLAEQAREQIELSCDEKCVLELKKEYSYQLADIVLNSTKKQKTFNPILGIKHTSNFNIKRLKRLSRMYKMKIRYLVAAASTLTLSAFSALAINSTAINDGAVNDDLKQNSQQQNSQEQKAHTEHVRDIKSKKRPKMNIYIEDHDEYNKLIDEMLLIAQQAKSNDKDVIASIYTNLYQWHTTRETLAIEKLEKRFKRVEFNFFNYLLTKLERYDEILPLYAEFFPEETTPPKFSKHYLAVAYSHIGQSDTAIELMTSFAHKQPLKYRVGSLTVLRYIYWAAEDYQQVINTADDILKLSPSKVSEVSSLSAKYHAYIKLNNSEKAEGVKQKIAHDYGLKPSAEPQSPKFSSPLLDYIP